MLSWVNNHHYVSQDSFLMINFSLEQFLQSLHIHISFQTKSFFLQLHHKDSHTVLHLQMHNSTICFGAASRSVITAS